VSVGDSKPKERAEKEVIHQPDAVVRNHGIGHLVIPYFVITRNLNIGEKVYYYILGT
jgi:hypothetical protein